MSTHLQRLERWANRKCPKHRVRRCGKCHPGKLWFKNFTSKRRRKVAKITSTVEVEVPAAFFTYDLATEELACRGCCKKEAFKILTAEAVRGGGPSVKKAFADFMNVHAPCAIRNSVPRKQDGLEFLTGPQK